MSKERIIVALDVAKEKEALVFVKTLKDYVGYFKVGLELFSSVGPSIIGKIRELGGKVFCDCKFKDIPNTVAGASRAITRYGVSMFNVHTLGGLQMMKSAKEASQQEARALGIEPPLVLGVTILTSIDQKMMNDELQIPGALNNQVVHLAKLASKAGLDGVIASAQELEVIREQTSKQLLIITPGIRPKWAAAQDQRRVTTPREAIKKGAFALVIGRPITKPPTEIGNSIDAAQRIAEEVERALTEAGA